MNYSVQTTVIYQLMRPSPNKVQATAPLHKNTVTDVRIDI